ncbi:MAG: hypothetical protein B6242_14805 [Anaerolineaceae bacterium 4572_78]|nr:MAG: hypothetical protein B6242_14805 [Anaerolineaceae bacterium 4572_78]RLE00074.1 MAG: hypothetical protein DRJ13_09155 [Bacteroidota bacterium]
MISRRTTARTFGIFFIITFLAYGIGSGFIETLGTGPDFLSNVHDNQSMIVFGVILMALVHTFLNIGMPVILLPILKRYNERLTYGYLSAAIASTVTLVVGALLLLLLIPLSDEFVKAGPAAAPYFETMGIIFKKGSVFAYHLGMALWSIGGVMFVSVLYKSKLIPRPMSVWGIIGYIVLISGSVMELFAHNDIVEIASVVPGGLFEITLSIWLIAKGFSPSAIASLTAKQD